jgi:serine/threonine-protein kinase
MAIELHRLQAIVSDRYELEREVGRGGMATVYLARDVKHDRRVAIKVLEPDLASSVGAERFQREIGIAATLTHPRIPPLHDSGSAGGVLFYVMPYIEGESLRHLLDREGQLPTEDVVRIIGEVAEALEYAHGQGVVHRDVKPDNILLTAGGAVVMDFGIASALEHASGDKLTQTGLVVGTPGYMAPEQSGEKAPDGRADQYALGCVAYEMLGGDPPFTGPTPAAILARHAIDPVPKLRTIRPGVSEGVERTIEKALAKVPADRFRSVAEFAEALVSAGTRAAVAGPEHAAVEPRWRRHLSYALPVAGVVVGIAWVLMQGRGDVPATGEGDDYTIRRLTSFVGWEWGPSWSPDGSMITYSHIAGGDADVATLSTGGGDPHILTGDSPADEMNPRWSPDGSKILFLSDRGAGTDIYWISPTGGAERKVAETHIPFLERMGAWARTLGDNPWSPDAREVLFSRLEESGDVTLWKANLATGEQTRLTEPSSGVDAVNGSWSTDGESILFLRIERGVQTLWSMLADGTGEAAPILEEPVFGQPAWFPDSERIVVSSPRSGAVNLWEVTVSTGAMNRLTSGAGIDWAPTVSRDGSIAYVQFEHQVDLYLARVDAPEDEHQRLSTYTGQQFGARVSPDGSQIAYYADRTGSFDLWLRDRETGQHRTLTEGPGNDRLLDWSPDGEQIVFLSDRDGAIRLWIAEAETGVARLLTDHVLPWSTHDAEGQGGPRWAPDGSAIGYLAPDEGGAIWLVEPDGSNRKASSVRGALSFDWYLDGRRVVYTRRAPDGSGAVELRAAHLDTGEDVLLRSGAIAEVDVSQDGRALTFVEAVSHFTMELYALPLTSPTTPDGLPGAAGEPERLTFGEGAWHVHSGGWTPDGTGVIYSRDDDRGDIYVIETGG